MVPEGNKFEIWELKKKIFFENTHTSTKKINK